MRDYRDPTDWDAVEAALNSRSGSRCEIRSPDCLGATIVVNGITTTGHIGHLPRRMRSAHHRRPRGMGGTRRVDVDSIAGLINCCGDGVTGCHGYVESNREWARAQGLLVPNHGTGDAVDPAAVPVVLPSGRRVLLDSMIGYTDPPDGILWVY